MTEKIIDRYGRRMNYLRISITDRCNLRCHYCMPQLKMKFLPKHELLSYEEMLRIIKIFESLGIDKLRFTGGEPFVRNDFMRLLKSIQNETNIKNCHITSNGTLTWKYIEELKSASIKGLNISLDTLKAERFKQITGFDALNDVLRSIDKAYESGIALKINTVFQVHQNADEILDLILAYQDYDIQLRLIEEMPFNEKSHIKQALMPFNLENYLHEIVGSMEAIPNDDNATSKLYKIKGMKLKLGIINAYTRNFCESCNRIRLNSEGKIKTCLYADAGVDIKALIRTGESDDAIRDCVRPAIYGRYKNGFEAEAMRSNNAFLESMSKIGG